MNMSYCRYRNTLHDLGDCASDIEERIDGGAADELSREEFEAACRLIEQANDLVATIREYAGLDDDEELTLDGIRSALADIEEAALRYAEAEDDEPTEEDLRQYAQDEAERAEMEAGWDPNP
jgi:hypothetical protein